MKERALTGLVLVLLAVGALAWQTYGLPDTWLADEITGVVSDMLARRSWNPRHFLYPSLMVDACYGLARILSLEAGSLEGWTALGHLCRSVSAGFYLLAVVCLGRTAELVLEKRAGTLPFAYFFVGTIGAFLHHAHIATVNSCFFFTIALALLQFVRTLASRRERDFYLSVLACSLAVGAKYNGFFLFLALPVLWLVTFEEPLRPARLARAVAVSVALAPLPFLATTPFCLLDHETFHKDWTVLTEVEGPAFKTVMGPGLYLVHFFGYAVAFFTPVGLALLTAWGLAVYGAWLRRLGAIRREKPLVFRASVVLGACFLLHLATSWWIGIYQSRYCLPAALVLAVLFLVALHGAAAPRLRRATVAVLVVLGAANAWANAAAFHLSAKARAASFLAPLEGRIGVIAYPARSPFEPGVLDARADVFMTDLADRDVETFEEYLSVVEGFFREKKPRWVVFEGIIAEWTVFRPRRDARDYGARIRYPNPGLAAWDAHLERAGYRRVRVLENCEGPLAMRWLLGGYYLGAAEGVGRPVHVYERRPEGAPR